MTQQEISPSPLLSLRDISLRFDRPRPVLDGFSLTIGEGEFIVLEGPSGGGKSTLLRLMVRLETPDSGEILFRERPLDALPPQELRTRVRLMPQIPVMLEGTVRDNLLLPFSFRQNRDQPVPDDPELGRRLERMRLDTELLHRPAGELSVGQQQRVALLRTLMVEPELLLLDEPTSGLDRESRQIVESTLFELNRLRGIAVALVSHHDLQDAGSAVRRVAVNARAKPGEDA